MSIPVRYLLALVLTVAIEGGVAWLFKLRTVRSQLTVALINCITNPTLNFFVYWLAWRGVEVTLFRVFLLEILVVIVEWGLLVYAFNGRKRRLLILSLAMNGASFLAGVLLFWL